jgi:tetratricopeptide (TPR) repeat protein
MRHQQQSWNNCGPATLSMLLSYFGGSETQQDIARIIKPFKDDKNVGPDELLSYATSAGYRARIFVGGNVNQLKALVASGLPVIVETWFIPDPNDEMGHYQLLVGYDGDTLRFFDSYHGPNITHDATEFDALWRVFNRLFIVSWKPEQEEQVQAILGPQWDETEMLRQALATAQAEAAANPRDKFAWFNIGTNALRLGDVAAAVEAYQKADALKLPWRMLWYQFGMYEAHFEAGNYAEVIKLANRTLRVQHGLEESYYWRGRAYAAQGKTQNARRDFQRALENNSRYAAAQEALLTTSAP